MKLWHWFRRQRLQQRGKQEATAGFTLLELLIALLVGSIILTGLMTLVIEMLRLERRETAVDDVQRDMRRAIDYMASDVAEAIYVYIPQKEDGSMTEWTDTSQDASRFEAIRAIAKNRADIDAEDIVFAFWRPDFIEDPDDLPPESLCGDANKRTNLTDKERDCRNLRERRGYFTLVIYQLVSNGDRNANGVWKGKARLERYELPMYEDTKTVDRSEGFDHNDGPIDTDPTDDQNINFFNWVPNGNTIDGKSTVLVDYVAEVDIPDDELNCSEGLIPVTAQNGIRSFYTCIRNPGDYDDPANRDESPLALENQNLEIHLQGDIDPRSGRNQGLGLDALSQQSQLPTLSTGVFVQGLIGYDPRPATN
jgi:prepilin-type N-terminal cleavage/methylation domain-containing protein